MNLRGVLYLLGRLHLALAVALLIPAAVAWGTGGDEVRAFLIAAAVVGFVGLASQWICRFTSVSQSQTSAGGAAIGCR